AAPAGPAGASDLLDRHPHAVAVDVELDRGAPLAGPEAELDRQPLAGDVLPVPPDRLRHRAAALDDAPAAVGHLEPHVLAQVVDGTDQLAGQPLEPELVVELEVEGDGPPAVLGHAVGLVARGPQLDVLRRQALAGDLDGPLGLELAVQRRAVG